MVTAFRLSRFINLKKRISITPMESTLLLKINETKKLHTLVRDKKRNRIITVEGFVFAPRYDKHNYIRKLEAILYSLKIVD